MDPMTAFASLVGDAGATPWEVGVVNAVLNTLQTIALAYIAAAWRLRNGGKG